MARVHGWAWERKARTNVRVWSACSRLNQVERSFKIFLAVQLLICIARCQAAVDLNHFVKPQPTITARRRPILFVADACAISDALSLSRQTD